MELASPAARPEPHSCGGSTTDPARVPKLARTNEFATIFLGLDQGSPQLRSSDIKSKNPFADRRVRQAVYQAIDIGTRSATRS